MKKLIVLTIALVFVSTSAFAVISNSLHDFTSQTWTNDICAPCHTPHNAVTGAAPLWSHVEATAASFTLYSSTNSATYDMTNNALDGISLACLSCHDGATNMDDFIGTASATPSAVLGSGATLIGTDLTNDHPISFTYSAAGDSQSGLHPIATVATNSSSLLVFYGSGSDQVECATCHDVHNTAGVAKLLRYSNAGSAMCLDCHNK